VCTYVCVCISLCDIYVLCTDIYVLCRVDFCEYLPVRVCGDDGEGRVDSRGDRGGGRVEVCVCERERVCVCDETEGCDAEKEEAITITDPLDTNYQTSAQF